MIDDDDLALLAGSFESVLAGAAPADADLALHELGWGDLLAVAGRRGAATAFTALGAMGGTAGLLDDVLAGALGLTSSLERAVVLPAPHLRTAPGRVDGGSIVVDGLVSARIDVATRMVVPVAEGTGVRFVEAEASVVPARGDAALDPAAAFRRVEFELPIRSTDAVELAGSWDDAVRDARVALAHQLIAVARVMIEQARGHAVDRVQFGRAIGSFQAVRHKLADALAAVEGAAAVAAVATEPECDPLTAAVAKSLAGKAARLTGTNAQQVLAGIGFTTDHPFHRSFKAALVVDTLFGSAKTLPSEIGRELLARGGAPRLVEL